MKSISKILDHNLIITYIKQTLLTRGMNTEELDQLEFTFIDADDNHLQCLISGNESAILSYNDYHCQLTNISGESISLSKSWRDFMLACISGISANEYHVINLKDCIASYMLEFQTNIVANSEIHNYANYLQNTLTKHGKKVIVLSDSDNEKRFRSKKDDLIAPTKNAYFLKDDKEIIDLNDYLFTSIDDDIFEDFMHAQYKFLDNRSSSM